MAYQSLWYDTKIPDEFITLIVEHCDTNYTSRLEQATLRGHRTDKKRRDSQVTFLESADWVNGFLMQYAMLANQENFRYDLTNLEAYTLQYTSYASGEHYGWHTDMDIFTARKPELTGLPGTHDLQEDWVCNNEKIRKLSFSLQLSDETDYEGGELQLMDNDDKMYQAPKQKGLLILFDSRARHRVRRVRSGCRKSLVGWVLGPRWR